MIGNMKLRFPRIRGDVPFSPRVASTPPKFSPHTRGCSGRSCFSSASRAVFPAYAGMFLANRAGRSRLPGFPRIRGDVPFAPSILLGMNWFSPHTRGCSPGVIYVAEKAPVFPAYAGMFLIVRKPKRISSCFPRIRGDVPTPTTILYSAGGFSPHTRGCSYSLSKPDSNR